MSRGLILLNAVGLTPSLVTKETPALFQLAQNGSLGALECPFPALTLSSQASLLTGTTPSEHGIVGNGWYSREWAEVLFWRQPHALLQREDLPTRLRRERPGLKVAKLFFWFNMYAPVDFAVTPRPMYPADGRKIPDIHTYPAALREDLQDRFGRFPLFHFWGPMAGLKSSEWITDSSLDLIAREFPEFALVYLPHLDYDFQRFGPEAAPSQKALLELDQLIGRFAEAASRLDYELVICSEYGIEAVNRPVHPNRALRAAGFLTIRNELGLERLDAGASKAFAVSDHQICHVYLNHESVRNAVRDCLKALPGVATVLEGESLRAAGMQHERCGDFLLVSEPSSWFTYYYWQDDALAPDYARTVDIHRKPGYDPAELFLDPKLRAPKLKIAQKLLAKRLGFRSLLDVIGLDSSIVRGSHGRRTEDPRLGPILLSQRPSPGLDLNTTVAIADFPNWLAERIPNPMREKTARPD